MLKYSHWRNAIVHRPYFFASLCMTAVLFALLAMLTDWMWATQLLLAWNVSVWLYLALTLQKLWHTSSSHILSRAQAQDLGKWVILLLVVLSLLMCLVAILVLLAHMPTQSNFKMGHLVLAVLTVCSAWFFIHTVFAVHYAHDYYLTKHQGEVGGLEFPGTAEPLYPDFIYFSYVIGTSAQTADVSISSRPMRVLNLLHIILAYGFNTTILAICINVAASFI